MRTRSELVEHLDSIRSRWPGLSEVVTDELNTLITRLGLKVCHRWCSRNSLEQWTRSALSETVLDEIEFYGVLGPAEWEKRI